MRLQPPPPPPPPQPRPLNSKIWRACAGASVQIPTVNSRVYYFPQGHLDQASSPPRNLSRKLLETPYVICRIAAVQLLADPSTDEVFAKLLLQPLPPSNAYYPLRPLPPPAAGDNSGDDENNVVSFAKILTASDANNGGGFSVPRYCADSIFPPLNFQADPPVQNLSITDVHGNAWEFRHIYRGKPLRHLLTTGWSKFVNKKKLVAGDSVVFMKNSKGEIFVGIRRTQRFASGNNGSGSSGAWFSVIGGGVRNRAEEEKKQGEKVTEGFSRNGKGKLPPNAVANAAELAAQGKPFEVVYYPSAGWSDFVLKAEIVDNAMGVVWVPDMRVKMAVETEDSSRMSWFQGRVSSISIPPDHADWRGSPWRMLQVAWDEPEVLKNAKWVSPWQVELMSTILPLHTAFPPAKRSRAAQGSGVLTDGEGHPVFPMTGFPNSTMGHFNQTLSSYSTFPDGMQGARHDLLSASNFPNFSSDNSRLCMDNSFWNNTAPRSKTLSTELNIGSSQSVNLSPDSQSSLHSFGTEFVPTRNCNSSASTFSNFSSDNSRLCMDNSFGNNTAPKSETLSTELNIGSCQSVNLSPDSQSSLHSFGTEFVRTCNCNSTKPGSGSFQLFGATIQTKQPVESGFHGTDCTREGYNETEGKDKPLGDSLT